MSKVDNACEQEARKALNHAAKRITAEASPDNVAAYETGCRIRLSEEHGDQFRQMARDGMTAEQIVEAHLAQPQSVLDSLLNPREQRPQGPEPRPKAHYDIADAERRANAAMIDAQAIPPERSIARIRAIRAQFRGDPCAECGSPIVLDNDFGWLHKDAPDGQSFDHIAAPQTIEVNA